MLVDPLYRYFYTFLLLYFLICDRKRQENLFKHWKIWKRWFQPANWCFARRLLVEIHNKQVTNINKSSQLFFSTFSQNDKCVGVGFSCIWKRDDAYDIVDRDFDVLNWHKVGAEIAANHRNPLERHLVWRHSLIKLVKVAQLNKTKLTYRRNGSLLWIIFLLFYSLSYTRQITFCSLGCFFPFFYVVVGKKLLDKILANPF